jgi:mono/diheme cytochrome c family protein
MKVIAAVALAFALVAPAVAQHVNTGQTVAQTWCAGCHNIQPAPKIGQDYGPPPFVAIANSKATTRDSLETFLQVPHGRMPDYSLTRQEIRDVSAYIVSLKKLPDRKTP